MARKKTSLLLGILLVGGGIAVILAKKKAIQRLQERIKHMSSRWRVVTINRPTHEITQDTIAATPLAAMLENIDIKFRQAPDQKGTEIAARFSHAPKGTLKQQAQDLMQLRRALRETKMQIETGEILQADKPGSARRTPLNLPLSLATRKAREWGWL